MTVTKFTLLFVALFLLSLFIISSARAKDTVISEEARIELEQQLEDHDECKKTLKVAIGSYHDLKKAEKEIIVLKSDIKSEKERYDKNNKHWMYSVLTGIGLALLAL